VATLETVRLGFIMEAGILAKHSMLLLGPTGVGKSWLSREVVYRQLSKVTAKYKVQSLVFSNSTSAEKTQ